MYGKLGKRGAYESSPNDDRGEMRGVDNAKKVHDDIFVSNME
jgi:hypothetical protein